MSIFVPRSILWAPDSGSFDEIAAELAETGFVVCPEFLDPPLAAQLLDEAEQHWEDGVFQRAAVGRGTKRQVRGELRSDHIHWLDQTNPSETQQLYWTRMEALREVLNATLYLGLFELEAHLARFPPGGYYKPHLDRHRGTADRVLSAVAYLDPHWNVSDGGQLRVYIDYSAGIGGPYLDIIPEPGKLVLFLSGEVWHEVLPAHRPRHTITAWFRQRELAGA